MPAMTPDATPLQRYANLLHLAAEVLETPLPSHPPMDPRRLQPVVAELEQGLRALLKSIETMHGNLFAPGGPDPLVRIAQLEQELEGLLARR